VILEKSLKSWELKLDRVKLWKNERFGVPQN